VQSCILKNALIVIGLNQVKEGNEYSIYKSKTIRLEQYQFFIQNSSKLSNTTLILLVFSQGFVDTYKHISFADLKKNHFRVLDISKPLSCSANRKPKIKTNYSEGNVTFH
jgi:hypothetical protein